MSKFIEHLLGVGHCAKHFTYIVQWFYDVGTGIPFL